MFHNDKKQIQLHLYKPNNTNGIFYGDFAKKFANTVKLLMKSLFFMIKQYLQIFK